MKKLLYSDLDGTLLSEVGDVKFISKKNIDSITKWIKKGNFFGVATGRNINPTLEVIGSIQPNVPGILMNGSLIYDFSKKKIIHKDEFNRKAIIEAIEYYKNNREKVKLILGEPWNQRLFADELSNHQNGYKHYPKNSIVHEKDLDGLDVVKIQYFLEPEYSKEVLNSVKKFKSSNNIDAFTSGPNIVEIVNKGTNKGKAIEYVLNYLDIDKESLYAVGDYNNDVEMVSMSKIGFAVSNSVKEVLDVATVVLDVDNNENAIKMVIDTLIDE